MDMTVTRYKSLSRQRGSTLTGIIIGLIIGLGIAVAVALVITKGASPFTERSNKMGRPADLEPSLATDPNKPLYGKREQVQPNQAAPVAAPQPQPVVRQPATPAPDADPLGTAIAGMQEPRSALPAVARAATPAPSGTPPSAATADGYIYYLQAGAFREMDDAENTRAKLALLGFEATISDRNSDSGVLHRVRVGPFTQVETVNKARAKLLDSGIDVAIVRNQR